MPKFDRLRGSRPTLDADRLKSQAAEVGVRLSDASARAGHAAETLAAQAKEAATAAKEWASPRVERAWYEGKKAAAPKIEAAAAGAIPIVDKSHDKLVDEILPKLVAAVAAAAGAAAAGADRAREVADAKLTDLAHIRPEPPRRRRTGAAIFWSIAGLAIAGAVVSVFRRRQATTDPWAEEPWDEVEADLELRAAEAGAALDEVEPAEPMASAEVVAERGLETAAAEAKAAAEETTEKLGEEAAPAKPRRTTSTTRTGTRTPRTTSGGAAKGTGKAQAKPTKAEAKPTKAPEEPTD